VNEALLTQLVEAVRAHYEDQSAPPLLASRFGHLHKPLLQELKAEFGTLLGAVRAASEQRLKIVDQRPGREVIAPADRAADIEVRVRERSASDKEAGSNFDSLPRAVQIAFCLRSDGDLVTLRVTPPFDYKRVASADLIRPGFRHVPDEYRKPGLSLTSAALQDKHALWQSFLAWTVEEQLDPATFRISRDTNALARFLAAQPPEIIDRIVIPADIAAILLRRS